VGHFYGRLGRHNEADQVLSELTIWLQRSYVPAYNLATVNVGLGKKDQALAFLDKAHRDRSMMMTLIKVDPVGAILCSHGSSDSS